MSDGLPFDTVELSADHGVSTLSVGEFLALPFSERVRAILSNSLRFFQRGDPVDHGVALRALRIRRADMGS